MTSEDKPEIDNILGSSTAKEKTTDQMREQICNIKMCKAIIFISRYSAVNGKARLYNKGYHPLLYQGSVARTRSRITLCKM